MFKRIATVLAGRSMARAAQFLAFLALGRMLTPSNFGLYGIFTTSVILAVQIGSLGLRQSAAVQIGHQTGPESARSTGRLYTTLLCLWPALTLLSALPIATFLYLTTEIGPTVWPNAILSIAGAMAVMLMQGLLLGLGRTSAFGMTDSLMPVVLLGGVGLAWLAGAGDLRLSLWIFTASQCVAGAATLLLGLRYAGLARPDMEAVWPMIRQGFIFSVNTFLIMLSTRVSLYMLETLISPEVAGQFFVGQRLSDLLGEVAMAAGIVLFSDAVRAQDKQAIMARNARVAATMFWGFSALALPFALLAEPLIRLSFGPQYIAAVPVLQITALAIGPASATKLLYPSLAALGKPLWGTGAICGAIIVNLGLAWALIPHFGPSGGAWALVVAQYCLFLGYAFVLRKRFGLPIRQSLWPRRA